MSTRRAVVQKIALPDAVRGESVKRSGLMRVQSPISAFVSCRLQQAQGARSVEKIALPGAVRGESVKRGEAMRVQSPDQRICFLPPVMMRPWGAAVDTRRPVRS